ncbi:ribosomal protein S18-alanine N-acetyltransferase [Enterococcus gallinarum]|nr:ribosomal protein S18-alanine N-acetyltransferase [Enterococcus gallinarum]
MDRNTIRGRFCSGNSEYLFLVENGQWLGYIAYHFILDEAEISHVVVNGQKQHQRWLSINESFLKEYVKSRNITQIFLEVERIRIPLAQKLCKKQVFRKVAVRKNYYKEPQENAFVMCAKLRKKPMTIFTKNVNYY